MNAIRVVVIDVGSKTCPEKISAVNTKMFFIHCFGRASLKIDVIVFMFCGSLS